MWQHQLCQPNISFFIRSVIFDIFASPGKLPTSWKGSYDFFFGIRRCSEFPDLVDDNILGFEYPLHFCNTSCISTALQYSISTALQCSISPQTHPSIFLDLNQNMLPCFWEQLPSPKCKLSWTLNFVFFWRNVRACEQSWWQLPKSTHAIMSLISAKSKTNLPVGEIVSGYL